jgi:hypothetical protein
MTPEELLKPRYKVIADYPGNEWKVGDILDRDWGWDGDDESGFKHHVSDYPHLFKKLHWADERPVEQMPRYIKGKERVYEVTGWSKDIIGHFYPKNKVEVFIKEDSENFSNIEWHFFKDQFLPATADDYNAYLQTLTVK